MLDSSMDSCDGMIGSELSDVKPNTDDVVTLLSDDEKSQS